MCPQSLAVCEKCRDPLPEFDHVVCSACKSRLHFECAGIKECNWRKLSSDVKQKWRCYSCKQLRKQEEIKTVGDVGGGSGKEGHQCLNSKCDTAVSNRSVSSEGTSAVLESLKVIVKQLTKEELADVARKIDDIEQFLNSYIEKQEQFLVITNKLSSEYVKLKSECDKLQEINRKIESDVSDVMRKVGEMKCFYNRNIADENRQEIILGHRMSNPSFPFSKIPSSNRAGFLPKSRKMSLIPVRPKRSTDSTSINAVDSSKELTYISSLKIDPRYNYNEFGKFVANEITSLKDDQNQKRLRLEIVKTCINYHEKENANSSSNNPQKSSFPTSSTNDHIFEDGSSDVQVIKKSTIKGNSLELKQIQGVLSPSNRPT